MKRVHSFKRLKGHRGSSPALQFHIPSDEKDPEFVTGTHHGTSSSRHGARPRSVSSASTSSGLPLRSLVATDSLPLPRNVGSTSDSIDGSDMIVTTDSWQHEAGEGIESTITATHTAPLGSAGGPNLGNGSGSDVPDGYQGGSSRSLATDHLKQKILKISEQIKIEQASRDENVAEYLKLAKDADKQQAARIKSVFEKKNQKSKAIGMQLQKKLENYHRRLKEIENNGPSKTQPKYGLKEVGAKFSDFSGGVVDSVRGSLSGLSQVTQNAAGAIVSKPKDFASKIKNRFGSADNIAMLKDDEDGGSEGLGRYNSADDLSMSTSGSVEFVETAANQVNPQAQHQMNVMRHQIANIQQQMSDVKQLEGQQTLLKHEIDQFKAKLERDIDFLRNSCREETFRCARLEDQLHDLTEMHHRELSDIKQEMSSMEEKFEYHSQERARDIQEALESCQTRISKMEVQQQHQHQQLVTMEGVENATARALLGKLINLLLSVLAVILVFVSTVSSIVMPFFRSQTRMIFTGLCVLFLAVLYRNWEPWTTSISDFWSGR